jgi:membrane associated rhomboid family serine protease
MIPIRNAVPSRPLVTWILIATNCLVFLFQDSLGPDDCLRQFALIPARYSEAFASGESDLPAVDFVPLFTVMFLHGGWLHLILNMDAVAVLIMADVGRKAITQVQQAASGKRQAASGKRQAASGKRDRRL